MDFVVVCNLTMLLKDITVLYLGCCCAAMVRPPSRPRVRPLVVRRALDGLVRRARATGLSSKPSPCSTSAAVAPPWCALRLALWCAHSWCAERLTDWCAGLVRRGSPPGHHRALLRRLLLLCPSSYPLFFPLQRLGASPRRSEGETGVVREAAQRRSLPGTASGIFWGGECTGQSCR